MGSYLAVATQIVLIVAAFAQLAPAIALADDRPPPPSPKVAPVSGPTPSPTPAPAPAIVFSAEQYAQALAIAQATSLGLRIDAERKLAAAERAFVMRRRAELAVERDRIMAQIATLQVEADRRHHELDRVMQREYTESRRTALEVLLSTGSIVSAILATGALDSLAGAHREAIGQIQRVDAELQSQRADLAMHEADLAALDDALMSKDALLAKFSTQADQLATGGGAAELRVLKDLVETELAAAAKVDSLVAAAASAAGAPAFQQGLSWIRPLNGTVTQGFGPTSLSLEPPRVYHGVTYPNFHDGLDIAAPLGSPVFAAADGTVVFVGHLPDGAMIVLLAHAAALFTLYAHLDDTHVPALVKVGDKLRAGDRIGVVGLTGITTGPHLHFVIRRGDEPIDPAGLIPAS